MKLKGQHHNVWKKKTEVDPYGLEFNFLGIEAPLYKGWIWI